MKKIIAMAIISLLSACSTSKNLPLQNNTDTNQVNSINFPEVKKAWLKEGDFVNVDNLRKVASGMTKNQLYALIGRPHFNEGIISPKIWNYVFNFRTGSGLDYVTCQYQIQFDNKGVVQSTAWKDGACANFLVMPAPQVIKEITKEVPAEFDMSKLNIPASQQFSIAGDVLFSFNKSSIVDIKNEGRAELDRIAQNIKGYKSIEVIRVVGHTDQLASAEYNFDLSYKRAQSVKQYLVSLGLDNKFMQVRGAGKTELVKTIQECNGNKNAKSKNKDASLHDCLLPNRRVVIEVIGVKG